MYTMIFFYYLQKITLNSVTMLLKIDLNWALDIKQSKKNVDVH